MLAVCMKTMLYVCCFICLFNIASLLQNPKRKIPKINYTHAYTVALKSQSSHLFLQFWVYFIYILFFLRT